MTADKIERDEQPPGVVEALVRSCAVCFLSQAILLLRPIRPVSSKSLKCYTGIALRYTNPNYWYSASPRGAAGQKVTMMMGTRMPTMSF